MSIVPPTMRDLVKAFVDDIEAAHGKGAPDLRDEWPDLHATYQNAVSTLAQEPTIAPGEMLPHYVHVSRREFRREAACWMGLAVSKEDAVERADQAARDGELDFIFDPADFGEVDEDSYHFEAHEGEP